MIFEPLEPGAHDWLWDDYEDENGNLVNDDLYCTQCSYSRDFSIDESEEDECPKNPRKDK